MSWPLHAAPGTELEAGLSALDRGEHTTALRLLGTAAPGADPRAAAALAAMHERGVGVSRDHAEALRWRLMAAERGDPESAYRIGLRHASGDGVERDDAVARRWFRIAAARGHGPAQEALAQLLGATGSSDADAREAVRWHSRAVAAGAVASPAGAMPHDTAPAGPTLSDIREARQLRFMARHDQRLHAPGPGWTPWGAYRDPFTGLLPGLPGTALLLPGALLVPGLGPVVIWPDGSARRGW